MSLRDRSGRVALALYVVALIATLLFSGCTSESVDSVKEAAPESSAPAEVEPEPYEADLDQVWLDITRDYTLDLNDTTVRLNTKVQRAINRGDYGRAASYAYESARNYAEARIYYRNLQDLPEFSARVPLAEAQIRATRVCQRANRVAGDGLLWLDIPTVEYGTRLLSRCADSIDRTTTMIEGLQ